MRAFRSLGLRGLSKDTIIISPLHHGAFGLSESESPFETDAMRAAVGYWWLDRNALRVDTGRTYPCTVVHECLPLFKPLVIIMCNSVSDPVIDGKTKQALTPCVVTLSPGEATSPSCPSDIKFYLLLRLADWLLSIFSIYTTVKCYRIAPMPCLLFCKFVCLFLVVFFFKNNPVIRQMFN
jgi:hypothetical protein